MASYAVHALIHRMDQEPGFAARFRDAPEAVLDECAIAELERDALLAANPNALASIGVHPLMQIRFLRNRFPERPAMMSINDWRTELLTGVSLG